MDGLQRSLHIPAAFFTLPSDFTSLHKSLKLAHLCWFNFPLSPLQSLSIASSLFPLCTTILVPEEQVPDVLANVLKSISSPPHNQLSLSKYVQGFHLLRKVTHLQTCYPARAGPPSLLRLICEWWPMIIQHKYLVFVSTSGSWHNS